MKLRRVDTQGETEMEEAEEANRGLGPALGTKRPLRDSTRPAEGLPSFVRRS